jgi:hypothetical protein
MLQCSADVGEPTSQNQRSDSAECPVALGQPAIPLAYRDRGEPTANKHLSIAGRQMIRRALIGTD